MITLALKIIILLLVIIIPLIEKNLTNCKIRINNKTQFQINFLLIQIYNKILQITMKIK